MNESEQVQHARRGSEAAWTVLVQTHQEAVFRLAYLLLGNRDEAEDVAQEVFVRAFRHLDRFDASRPLRPWLLRITRNLAYNRQRSLRRYWRAVNRLFAEPPATAQPAQRAEQQVQAELLWQAVRQLPEPDQEIIYLRYFLALSVAESAETLDVAEGTVKSRLHRALDRLKRVVETEYPALREEWAP